MDDPKLTPEQQARITAACLKFKRRLERNGMRITSVNNDKGSLTITVNDVRPEKKTGGNRG